MSNSLAHLKEWWAGHDCLLIIRESDSHVDLEASGFIKKLTGDEIILDLIEIGEFRLPVVSSMTFTYLDADNAAPGISKGIKSSVVIKWPGFRFSLSLLRTQPIINYPTD